MKFQSQNGRDYYMTVHVDVDPADENDASPKKFSELRDYPGMNGLPAEPTDDEESFVADGFRIFDREDV
jgi:hypothetical protein